MSRPRLLTHWTGKDICTNLKELDHSSRATYMERLLSIIEEGQGLWMTSPPERLLSVRDGESLSFTSQGHMTCFTELRPSQAQVHQEAYGLLGIVVDRAFVLERRGNPAHYVRSAQDDAIVQNFSDLFKFFRGLQPILDAEFQASLNPQILALKFSAQITERNMVSVVAFLKSMSSWKEDSDQIGQIENFENLEEHEWRICHFDQVEKRGLITRTGAERPKYKLPLKRSDLQMLIVPDVTFRNALCINEQFKAWLGNDHLPILTTEEVQHL